MALHSALRALILSWTLITPSTTAIPRQKTSFNWHKIEHLIAFGDSYTYVQGTAGRQNFSFIGDYLPGNFAYTAETLLTDQIVQNFTGTAEGGPNWVEYLTGCGLEPGLTSPLTCKRHLWDFAFAGADVSEAFTPLHHDFTTPLVNQTRQFLSYGDAVLKEQAGVTAKNTLVAFWIGINDINDSAKYKVPSFQSFYETIVDTIFSASVVPMEKAGYKNFLFLNLPPLDRTQSNLLLDPAVRLPNTTMLGWWNDALARRAAEFAQKTNGVKAMVWNANSFLNDVLDHAEHFGIRNTTHFCPGYLFADVLVDPGKYGCPVPLNEYFWFNSGHMTSRVHELMAPELENFLKENSNCR